jgi:hypothetical protein
MRSVSISVWSGVITTLASIRAASATTGQLGDASKYVNNPQGAAYIAEFPPDHPLKGGIIATSAEGAGTQFTVNFFNLPVEGGPFGKQFCAVQDICD